MPIWTVFINPVTYKSYRTCLTNCIWSISHHITPLVINSLRVDTHIYKHIHTHIHTHANTHTYRHLHRNNFKNPGVHWPAAGGYLV